MVTVTDRFSDRFPETAQAGRPTDAPALSFSVVMPNYNYGRFVGDAVRSALAIDWPAVEVIVVDDGSTDDSLDVLAQFGDRITVISQENAGPRAAINRGYAASSGDVVIFLDSDDQLEPSIAHEVARVWRGGISKVQAEMLRVDSSGAPAGGLLPRLDPVPTSEQVRRWMAATGEYPTPPGSGNVYARSFLERLFPLDDSAGDATDSYTLAAAPFLGDVVSIPKPLSRYRVHDDNRSKLSNPKRFTHHIQRAFLRHRFALRVSGQPFDDVSVAAPLRRGRHLLQLRVAERRLVGGTPPLAGDTRARLVADALLSVFAPGPERPARRLLVVAWCWAVLLAPRSLALALISRRFDPSTSTLKSSLLRQLTTRRRTPDAGR